MKIDQEHRPRRPVRQLAVPDDGAPPQRCPCCPCRGAEKVWLVAIRPFDSIARPCDRRSVVGVGSKGGLAGCAHELRRRHRRHGGRSWAARRAVLGWFPVAGHPKAVFPSRWEVRTAASAHNVPLERCCSRRIVGGRVWRRFSLSRWATSTRRTGSCSYPTAFRRSSDPIRPSDRQWMGGLMKWAWDWTMGSSAF